jgi:hypothetical protein
MYRFWHSIIEPLCTAADVRTIVEIGIGEAPMTRLLVAYAKVKHGHIHAIDPLRGEAITMLIRDAGSLLEFHQCTSLEILPALTADAVLIDGDHNWYTVSHELKTIADWNDDPLIFLHDTGWPYGRRDLYYDSTRIPRECRHASATLGMDPSSPDLVTIGGLNKMLENARTEGGTRNGVLTAIEDFLKTHQDRWSWIALPGIHGLGILIPKHRLEKYPDLASLLTQLNISPLLQQHMEAIERDRLSLLVHAKNLEQEIHAALEQKEQQIRIVAKDNSITLLQEELRRIKCTRSWQWTQYLRRTDAWIRRSSISRMHDLKMSSAESSQTNGAPA